MELRRKHGFTLIELLVVIAIIGILAAMLFPVFARARESARKTQCLANVKNIAIGMNMYLTDYDALPPRETRADIQDWLNNNGGGSCWIDVSMVNPYLQWPVVLDDYIKNRDVWKCPSAQLVQSYGILNSYGQDWWAAVQQKQGCGGASPCDTNYPPGWGGSVTDSVVQQLCAGGTSPPPGSFVQDLGCPDARGVKTSEMEDVTKYMICGDVGTKRMIWAATQLAYPDLCSVYCAKCSPNYGCYGDPAQVDSLPDCSATKHPEVVYDTQARKMYGRARHMGGSNVGFADGHAKWFASEAILSGCTDNRWFITDAQRNKDIIISNVELCGPMNLPGGVQP